MTLLLIDVSHLFWSAWHATSDREVGAAYESTIERVTRLCDRYPYAAVCCDSPPYWRKDLAPSYKAQRDAPEPMAVEQFRRTKDRIAKDGRVMWLHAGFEADDIIAGAVAWARTREEPLDVVIASNDKDLLQLVGDGVAYYSTKTDTLLGAAEVEAKFGVGPERMRDWLALVGDKSDNVPGIPGVGPVRAAKLLQQFGTLAGIVKGIELIEQPKLREALQQNLASLEMSRKLVTLRTDAPIDYEAVFRPREVQPVTDFQEADFEDVEDEEDEVSAAEKQPEPETPSQTEAEPVRAKSVTNGNGAIVVAPQQFEQGLQPTSIGSAYKLAKGLFESRLYSRFPNPEAIMAIVIRGREMGLGALTALDNFHLIEGKPAPHAHLLVARAKAHPDCEYFQFIGGDETYAEYETKHRRNPKPTRLRYTIEQAERAGITRGRNGQPTNWQKRPDEMLRKTCAVQLGRIEYPEAMQGLYAIEELGEQ